MAAVKYLRFKQGTGSERQQEIRTLINYGVKSIEQAFEHDKHPERSSTYLITMKEGISLDVLRDYFSMTTNVFPVSDEEFARIKDDVYIPRDRKGNPIDYKNQ